MGCSHPEVPKYLHYTSRKKRYTNWRFFRWHYIYRTGHREKPNPIDTDSMRSGYSVCWSKLINHLDVLKTVLAENPRLGDTVYYGKCHDIKKVSVEFDCPDGVFCGRHLVKPLLIHSPVECNYSHAEILIMHSYYEDGSVRKKILKYEDWANSVFATGKPPAFFKELRNKYRSKMLTVLNNELDNKELPILLKFHPKKALIRFLIYLNLR